MFQKNISYGLLLTVTYLYKTETLYLYQCFVLPTGKNFHGFSILPSKTEKIKYLCVIQFNRYQPDDGRISEKDFASMLLTYAGFPDKKKALMIRRVKKAYKGDENAKVGECFVLLDYISRSYFVM